MHVLPSPRKRARFWLWLIAKVLYTTYEGFKVIFRDKVYEFREGNAGICSAVGFGALFGIFSRVRLTDHL
jgi:hypothetical protein